MGKGFRNSLLMCKIHYLTQGTSQRDELKFCQTLSIVYRFEDGPKGYQVFLRSNFSKARKS